jgi:DNA segregation ATPase FtsK/SpoIIIE-like protein
VVIDEFADMMMIVGKKVEELIARIASNSCRIGLFPKSCKPCQFRTDSE